eukprot:4377064-Amphidinium_carterae.1
MSKQGNHELELWSMGVVVVDQALYKVMSAPAMSYVAPPVTMTTMPSMYVPAAPTKPSTHKVDNLSSARGAPQ